MNNADNTQLEAAQNDFARSLKQIISGRQSIREFLKEPVKKELLLEVINAARLAPSPTNSQPWYFLIFSGDNTKRIVEILLQDAEKIDIAGYKKICFDSARIIAGAPHLITVWNMKYSSKRLSRLKELIGGSYYENYEIAEILSIGCAVENMWLTAESLGLGMVWLMPNLRSLNLFSQEFQVDGAIAAFAPIGYPAKNSADSLRTQRKPLDKISGFYDSKETGK